MIDFTHDFFLIAAGTIPYYFLVLARVGERRRFWANGGEPRLVPVRARRFILNKKPVPRQTPPLNTVVRLIAQRGGFLGRKHDGEPGARTIWLGMQEIAVFVAGARYARQLNDECAMGCGVCPCLSVSLPAGKRKMKGQGPGAGDSVRAASA